MPQGIVAISGAAMGIGAALALEAVARGYSVAVFDRDARALAHLRNKLGASCCVSTVGDCCSTEDVRSFADQVGAQGRPLRFTFANAGILRVGGLQEQALTELAQLLQVNVFGAICFARELLPLMSRDQLPSKLVFTGSTSMFSSVAGFGGYSASKHALLAIAEAWDAELAATGSNVSVAILSPAAVQTNIADGDDTKLVKLRQRMTERGITATDMARLAFDQISAGRQVVFSDGQSQLRAKRRLDAMCGGQFLHRMESRPKGD